MQKVLVLLSIIVGIVLFLIAAVYFVEPARSLPTFFPGYAPTLAKHHLTHGVAAVVVGLLLFAFAWFKTGKKSAK